jgi:serine/threonine protein kinase
MVEPEIVSRTYACGSPKLIVVPSVGRQLFFCGGASTPARPKAIGQYKLVGRLGAGGMGVVYIASKGSETVALKIIRDSIIDDPSQATRFIREIETLKSINSSHVAKVLDTGTHNERPWFTTEFVNGPDLKSYVRDKGPLTGQAWDSLAKGLLDGISAIHAAEVIHRDIKPANIILSETGPKIIDFGIARWLTQQVSRRPAQLREPRLGSLRANRREDANRGNRFIQCRFGS